MNAERAARWFVLGLALGVPLAILAVSWLRPAQTLELHARMAESGGWTPDALIVKAGEPLRLRLTSDDVLHGLAVGQTDWPAVDVFPGKVTETTLTFDRPGTYAFYCTRWCGVNHWRMRGTIEVTGDPTVEPAITPPLYVTLGIDIDRPHPAATTPARRPSAGRGAALGVTLPMEYLTQEYYRSHAPMEVWRSLRAEPFMTSLSDDDVWDLVAFAWESNTSPEAIGEGGKSYAANCAACHGEQGGGDGVMAEALVKQLSTGMGHEAQAPASFIDAASMLGASPALLQGKIIRGGMGTGMPAWGAIFTEPQTWALVDYLWTFQFD